MEKGLLWESSHHLRPFMQNSGLGQPLPDSRKQTPGVTFWDRKVSNFPEPNLQIFSTLFIPFSLEEDHIAVYVFSYFIMNKLTEVYFGFVHALCFSVNRLFHSISGLIWHFWIVLSSLFYCLFRHQYITLYTCSSLITTAFYYVLFNIY